MGFPARVILPAMPKPRAWAFGRRMPHAAGLPAALVQARSTIDTPLPASAA
jgi:hypothetical protein